MALTPDPTAPEIIYGEMTWNAPLSEDHAGLLLNLVDAAPDRNVLDLGCGWGELLLRALSRAPEATRTGVDTADWALERGRQLAEERGLSDRVAFVVGDAKSWNEPADRLLCVGASHAWGGNARALNSLRSLVRPGGRLIFGDGCWSSPPTADAASLFGDAILGLDALVGQALSAGWRVMHLTTADQHEWDTFETAWRAGREAWLQNFPLDPRGPEIRAHLDERLREYVSVYRNVLGFAYLVLA